MSSAANPPQETINATFGAMVSGVWIQQLLLGFILAQMVDYYRYHFQTDSIFNKTMVTLLLLLNILLGGTDFHVLYRSAVLFYGDFGSFNLQQWTMWTEPGWTAIVGFLAQLFFLVRCQRIVKSKFITASLSLLVIFSVGAGLAVCGSFIRDRTFSSLGDFKKPIILWLVSTAVADVSIATVLITHLLRSRTPYKSTNTVIIRTIVISMETSATTGIVATLNLVLFLPLEDTAYHLLPQFSMSRVYTITVMATLLARTTNRKGMTGETFSSAVSPVRFRAQDNTNSISVGVTTTTHQHTDQNNTDRKDSDIEPEPVADYQESRAVEEV